MIMMEKNVWAIICLEPDRETLALVTFGFSEQEVIQKAQEKNYPTRPSFTFSCTHQPDAYTTGFRAFLAELKIFDPEAEEIIQGFAKDIKDIIKIKYN